MVTARKVLAREARHRRVRKKVSGAAGRPRLCVFRSQKQIYAQLVDDVAGHTVAAASSLSAEFQARALEKEGARGSNRAGAELVGALIAERARKAEIKTAVFDRGGYLYHGRVKALADAARAAGIEF